MSGTTSIQIPIFSTCNATENGVDFFYQGKANTLYNKSLESKNVLAMKVFIGYYHMPIVKTFGLHCHYPIKSFASVYLENKHGQLVIHQLPKETQLSGIIQILADTMTSRYFGFSIAGNLDVSLWKPLF